MPIFGHPKIVQGHPVSVRAARSLHELYLRARFVALKALTIRFVKHAF